MLVVCIEILYERGRQLIQDLSVKTVITTQYPLHCYFKLLNIYFYRPVHDWNFSNYHKLNTYQAVRSGSMFQNFRRPRSAKYLA